MWDTIKLWTIYALIGVCLVLTIGGAMAAAPKLLAAPEHWYGWLTLYLGSIAGVGAIAGLYDLNKKVRHLEAELYRLRDQ